MYYALRTLDLSSFNSGSAQPSLNRNFIATIPMAIPPAGEQRRIADVRGALDNKIESNRRLATVLEETSAALFRARFIDFVGVTDLAQSEIGPIPCNWAVRSIGTVARTVGGGTPSTKVSDFWEGGMHAWATPERPRRPSIPSPVENSETSH